MGSSYQVKIQSDLSIHRSVAIILLMALLRKSIRRQYLFD